MNQTYVCFKCRKPLTEDFYSLVNWETTTRRQVRYCKECFDDKLKREKMLTICKCGQKVDIDQPGIFYFYQKQLYHEDCEKLTGQPQIPSSEPQKVNFPAKQAEKTPKSVKCFFCGDLVSNDIRVNWMNRWYHPGCLAIEKQKRENRTVVCYGCGGNVKVEDRILENGKSFHPNCYEEFQKQKQAKSVKCHMCGEQVLVSERVADDQGFWYHPDCLDLQLKRTELLNYICMLFGLKKPGPVVFTQLKRFTQNLGYTYDGILKALKYHYEIQHGDKEKANEAIGIVPYIYDESMNYWNFIKTKQKQIVNEIEPTLHPPKIQITIQSDKPKRAKEKYNFDDLL